jgi:hypothetical protein
MMLEGSGIIELRRMLKVKGSGRKASPTVPLSGVAGAADLAASCVSGGK